MNYISSRDGRKRNNNEPYEISKDDINYMLHQNEMDKQECFQVTESTYRGESYFMNDGHAGSGKVQDGRFALFKEILYRDVKTNGFVMEYPHGIIISQGARNSYYRGENQIYQRSVSSLYRSIELMNEEERRIYQFINKMRLKEFEKLICRFDITQFWINNNITVLFEPLAQHYGMETTWLDITSDLEVALFFATCKWNQKDKRWYPLTKKDTEQNEKTKYGVIFHVPSWQINASISSQELIENMNVILPIGYQPFMRCHSQHAYGINMNKPRPLQNDYMFEKLHFRHDEKFSQMIYEKMGQGRNVYPREGLDNFACIIDELRRINPFSREVYEEVLGSGEFYSSDEDAKKALGNSIVIVDKSPVRIPRQWVRRLNRQYKNFSFEKTFGIKLITRKVMYPRS